jgi:hypothetical protein
VEVGGQGGQVFAHPIFWENKGMRIQKIYILPKRIYNSHFTNTYNRNLKVPCGMSMMQQKISHLNPADKTWQEPSLTNSRQKDQMQGISRPWLIGLETST